MKVVEVAQVLGVTDRHVRDLIQQGRLRAVPVTRRLWLVDRTSVEIYRRERRTPGRPRRRRVEGAT